MAATNIVEYIDSKYCILDGVLLSYGGEEENVVIPAIIGAVTISRIGRDSFSKNKKIRTIKIPDGIEEIGEGAFSDCAGIEQVVLPKTLKKIGSKAFLNCRKMSSIEIPEGVRNIGEKAFEGCDSLRKLVLPAGLSEETDLIKCCPPKYYCNLYLKFTIDKNEFKKLEPLSIKLNNGDLLLRPEADSLEWLSVLKGMNLPKVLDKRMGSILIMGNIKIDVNTEVRRLCLSWDGNISQTTERSVLEQKINSQTDNYYIPEVERIWEDCITEQRGGTLTHIFHRQEDEPFLCVLDEVYENVYKNTITGIIKVYREHAFFVSYHRVMFEGRPYYIYSRNYLIGRSKKGHGTEGRLMYCREDVAVFYNGRMINDRELSEKIYGKYKLLSML